jgi:hypothetical protein
MMTVEAHVHTDQASRHLVEVCRRLDERTRTDPELGVSVAWTEADGTIEFGWGRCTLCAAADTLTLRAEAADADGLRQVRELISRHLEKHADDDELTLTWWQDGTPVSDTRRSRRDAMRAFHRRMRH